MQLIDFPRHRNPVPFGGSQQLAENTGQREEKIGRNSVATRLSGQQLRAANGAEPWAFAQGSMRQRNYSLEVMAEGEGFEPSIRLNTVYTLSRRAPSTARPPVRNLESLFKDAGP